KSRIDKIENKFACSPLTIVLLRVLINACQPVVCSVFDIRCSCLEYRIMNTEHRISNDRYHTNS
ncbi:MAG TPA: hypothetical protein VEW65_14460, partial [Chryseolinea sp.]|nr:hypothetical protein [Chryseolinea sp.]